MVKPHTSSDDLFDGEDYFYDFEMYQDASNFASDSTDAEAPLA